MFEVRLLQIICLCLSLVTCSQVVKNTGPCFPREVFLPTPPWKTFGLRAWKYSFIFHSDYSSFLIWFTNTLLTSSALTKSHLQTGPGCSATDYHLLLLPHPLSPPPPPPPFPPSPHSPHPLHPKPWGQPVEQHDQLD